VENWTLLGSAGHWSGDLLLPEVSWRSLSRRRSRAPVQRPPWPTAPRCASIGRSSPPI